MSVCGSDDLDRGTFGGDPPNYFSDGPKSNFFGKKSEAILCTSCGFLYPFLPEGDYEEFSRKARGENK
jgi:hypothetical protein